MSKKANVVEQTPNAKSKKMFWVIGTIVAVCLISVLLIILEVSGSNKLTVKNNTSHNLEYVRLKFASMDTDYTGDVFFNKGLSAGQTITEKTSTKELYGTEARLFVIFKFEGEEERRFDNGWFSHDFSGKTLVEFDENAEGKLELNVSIKEGFANGGNNNECDEHWELNTTQEN